MIKRILTIGIVFYISVTFCYALETDTHETINEHIARNSFNGFSLNSYLKLQLGIQGGIEEKFNFQEVRWWLKKGGLYEDVPYWYMQYLRSVNHFHDPISNKGYSGFWGTGVMSGQSSVLWSQLSKGMQNPGGYYSWHDARDYFYRALTSANKTDRQKFFAETFRGIGQLMHLVEDASVPAHTRNDGHAGYHYEVWVKNNRERLNLNPITFDKSILNFATNLSAPVPISNIIDTNQYEGSNPGVTYGSFIGISEYTNANFFSEDTIFKNYPHPTYEDTNYHIAYGKPEIVDAEDGKFDNRVYVKKTVGEADTRLAAFSYISYDVIKKGYYQFSPLVLDDKVYSDYAALLIPRAVGYSTGLLNYFFRGDIDMVPDDTAGSGYVIVNNTDEDMNGTFELWYDNDKDERAKVSNASWTLNINEKSSGNNKSTNITFTEPSDAKEPSKYILVFRGKLGNEADAVVGKTVKTEEIFIFLVPMRNRQNPLGLRIVSAKGSGVTLTPSDPEILQSKIEISGTSTLLVIQSHPESKEAHMAYLPFGYKEYSNQTKREELVTTYAPDISTYGAHLNPFSPFSWATIGTQDVYRPVNFETTSEYSFSSSIPISSSNAPYNLLPTETLILLSSGRRNFSLTNEGKLDKYWMFAGFYNPAIGQPTDRKTRLYYKGIDSPFDPYLPRERQGNPQFWHVKDLFLYKGISNISSSGTRALCLSYPFRVEPYSYNTSESLDPYVVSLLGDKFIYVTSDSDKVMTEEFKSVGYMPMSDSNSERTVRSHYYLGERLIETTYATDSSQGRIMVGECDSGGYPFQEYNYSQSIASSLTFMDYDYTDNGDTFVMFVKADGVEASSSSVFTYDGTGNPWDQQSIWNSSVTTTTTYRIVYQIKSGGFRTIDIPAGMVVEFKDNAGSYSGQRITGISSQINSRYMVYTYIIEDVGTYTYFLNNSSDSRWLPEYIFNKRIVGIINLGDPNFGIGYRQEFEITNSNKGVFMHPKTVLNYDIADYAAIGVHRQE